MSHRLQATYFSTKPPTIKRDIPVAPQWPSYQGTPQFVGTSPSGRVTAFVDPSLGDPGLQNAQDLVNDADRVANANDQIFGTPGGPVSVVVFALGGVTDGTGGADHMGCDYATGAAIEVCASFGNSARVSALFEAELSECSMGGNLCGVSTGEARSRWCAAVVGNNALSDFATAPTWANNGMPDYVDQTDPTDQNADSTGCGMAFISWLLNQGITLNQVAQGLVALTATGTFAQLYANLTSQSPANAWPSFQAAVQNLTSGITNDDPLGGAAQPAQLSYLAPWTVDLAGKVFAAILADVASGKPAHRVVASVRAAMGASAQVQTTSHRLHPTGRSPQSVSILSDIKVRASALANILVKNIFPVSSYAAVGRASLSRPVEYENARQGAYIADVESATLRFGNMLLLFDGPRANYWLRRGFPAWIDPEGQVVPIVGRR